MDNDIKFILDVFGKVILGILWKYQDNPEIDSALIHIEKAMELLNAYKR